MSSTDNLRPGKTCQKILRLEAEIYHEESPDDISIKSFY